MTGFFVLTPTLTLSALQWLSDRKKRQLQKSDVGELLLMNYGIVVDYRQHFVFLTSVYLLFLLQTSSAGSSSSRTLRCPQYAPLSKWPGMASLSWQQVGRKGCRQWSLSKPVVMLDIGQTKPCWWLFLKCKHLQPFFVLLFCYSAILENQLFGLLAWQKSYHQWHAEAL